MNQNRVFWLVLFGSLVVALALMLALESTGQAAPSQPQGVEGENSPNLTQEPVLGSRQVVPREPLGVSGSIERWLLRGHANFTGTDLNCRYGVAGWGSMLDHVPVFGAGWYLTFGTSSSPPGPDGAEFVQVIRVRQNKDGCTYLPGYSVTPPLTDGDLGAKISANLGSLWIVGNEPDRGPNPGECTSGQDDTFPEVYAEAYHDVYHFIKQRDRTAQVAVAGLVEVTPGRLQYLDKAWQAYLQEFNTPMPVDVWNMHLYILPEAQPNGQPNGIANIAVGTDPALAVRESGADSQKCSNLNNNVYCFADHDNLAMFADQIIKMRTWMKEHGQQNKPLILSEYSLLYPFRDYDDPVNPTYCFLQDEYGGCFTSARVSSFMTRTFDYLETAVDTNLGYPADNYRLVQQWLWFSLRFVGAGNVSNLLEADESTLTQVGYTFQEYVTEVSTYTNLFPDRVPSVVASSETDSVTVTLLASVRNNGNVQVPGSFTVTFYSNASLTQPIGSGVVSDLGGCTRREVVVTTTWGSLQTGAHYFWVGVDSTDVVTESLENDNVAQGLVIVNPSRVFLPLVFRQERE